MGIPAKNGGTLNDGGTPGNKGGGDYKKQWKLKLANIAGSPAAIAHIKEIVKQGPSNPFFTFALTYATEHGLGKAETSGTMDHTSGGQPIKALVGIDVEKDI